MAHTTRRTQHNRFTLLSTVAASAMLASAPVTTAAFAQDEEIADDAEDTIIVTGSRIRRDGFNTPQPVTVLDSEAIALSGTATNIGNFLNELPALGTTFTTANSTRFIGTGGGSLLDLRGLGTSRTLVLVDGKRHISSSPGTAAVDVNTIPTDLIERVEVITGGASAIYGADAVTGVVNFVMRDDFEGLKFRGQVGTGATGVFDDFFLAGTGGVSFDDGRGNAVLSVEYAERSMVQAADVSNSVSVRGRTIDCTQAAQDRFGSALVPDDFIANGGECTVPNAGLAFINATGIFTAGQVALSPLEPFFASAIDPDGDGVFESSIPYYTFTPSGDVRLANTTNFTNDLECFDCDFLDLVETTTAQPRINRVNFTSRISYEIAPWLKYYASGKYVNTFTKSFGQPTFNNAGRAIPILSDNAYASPSLQQFFSDNGIDRIFVQRFNNDLGRRGEENERQTYRVVTGFKGDFVLPIFGDRNWNYDLSFNYGETSRQLIAVNNRFNENFFIATDAVFAPDGSIECRVTQQLRDGLSPTDANGNPVDLSVAERCVPANVLGFGNISPDAVAFINVDSVRTDKNTQLVWNGSASGDLFDLPAGPVGFALGGEYREEQSVTRPAKEDSLGLTFGNTLQVQQGKFDVWEMFAETRVPILADLPFAHELSLEGAVRYGDYSTIGSATAYQAKAQWAPIEDVSFRGVYAVAIRAPNIAELFGPLDQNFFTVTDPCSESDIVALEVAGTPQAAAQAAARRTNCATLGRPAGFESAVDDATIPGQSGGNPNLSEERAVTYTVGAVLQPRFLPGFAASVDYYNVRITDGIGATDAQEILDLCVEGSTVMNAFCTNITRDPSTFEITNILSSAINFSKIEVEGIDYELSYRFDTNALAALVGLAQDADLGQTALRVIGSHYMTNRDFPLASDPDDPESQLGELGVPRNIFNFNLVQRTGPLTFNYDLRYLGNQLIVDDEDFIANPFEQFPFETGRAFYQDVSARYDISESVSVYGGIDNITNNLPSDFLGVSTGTGAGSGIFNNLGRYFYLGAELTF